MIESKKSFFDVCDLAWKKTFIAVLRKKKLDQLVAERKSFSLKHDQLIYENWSDIKDLTLVDPFRIGKLLDVLYQVQKIPGDIYEFGSYKGGTGIMMALLCKQLNLDKKVHLFDSFEGLPEPDLHYDSGYRAGDFVSNYGDVLKKVKEFGLEDIIVLHKGWFSETLEKHLAADFEQSASLVHIDCDLYQSTKDSLGPALEILSDGTAIIFDDFNDGGGGERKAVYELITTSEILHIGPAPQVYMFKGDASEIMYDYMDQNFKYSFDTILANSEYNEWCKLIGKIDLSIEYKRILND